MSPMHGSAQVIAMCSKRGRRPRGAIGEIEKQANGDKFKVQLANGTVEILNLWQASQAVQDFKKQETDGWVTLGPSSIRECACQPKTMSVSQLWSVVCNRASVCRTQHFA